MKKQIYFLSLLIAGFAPAQSYENGGLSTGPTAKNGSAAPAGYTWSELQNNTGNTAESNTSIGLGGTYSSASASFFIADDFVVPAGEKWEISSIDFFAYQTSYVGVTSPFNTVRVNVFSSDPSVVGATSVFGDDTANRFLSSVNANIYRIANSLVPVPATPGTARQVWKVTANTPMSLNAGTYWVKYQLQNIVTANAGFLPPVSVPGTRGLPGFNAKQFNAVAGTWAPIIDDGNPTTAPDYPLDMPFVITYTKTILGSSEVLQYDNRINVYPNPAKEEFRIAMPQGIVAENIQIFDASGRLIKTMKTSDSYNISELKSGVYTVKINTSDIAKTTRLIVK